MAVGRLLERGRSFNPYDYKNERFRLDNHVSDLWASVAIFCLTFPNRSDSSTLLEQAVPELRWQQQNVIGSDGGYPDGTRYQGNELRIMLPVAFACRQAGKRSESRVGCQFDFFASSELQNMVLYMAKLQTPPDKSVHVLSITKKNYRGCRQANSISVTLKTDIGLITKTGFCKFGTNFDISLRLMVC